MTRKTINVFNISFLDLICGALGAVILLFIIVPKLDSKSQKELEAISQANLELSQLENILEELENSVSSELYEEIQNRIESLEDALEEVENEVQELRDKLSNAQEQIQSQQNRITELQESLKEITERADNCEENMEKLESQGRFAVVTMSWNTTGDDVDLHVVDPTGAEFSYRTPSIAGRPGKLTKDDTYGPGVEVWQISFLETGRYTIYTNLYESKSKEIPNIEAWIYFRNGNKVFKGTIDKIKEKRLITSFTVDDEGNITFS